MIFQGLPIPCSILKGDIQCYLKAISAPIHQPAPSCPAPRPHHAPPGPGTQAAPQRFGAARHCHSRPAAAIPAAGTQTHEHTHLVLVAAPARQVHLRLRPPHGATGAASGGLGLGAPGGGGDGLLAPPPRLGLFNPHAAAAVVGGVTPAAITTQAPVSVGGRGG